MSDTALATIAERDRRIATLAKQLLSNEKSLIDADSRIAELEKEGERLEKEKWSLTNSRDTATRELAEAKAEIARLRKALTKIAKTPASTPCGEAIKSTAQHAISSFAHDTSEPSAERPVCQHCGKTESEHRGSLCNLSYVMTHFTPVIHAPMAYETFVLMKQALEAQCKATASVTAERDQLRKENQNLQSRLDQLKGLR